MKPWILCTVPPLGPAHTEWTAHILITQTGELKMEGKITQVSYTRGQ